VSELNLLEYSNTLHIVKLTLVFYQNGDNINQSYLMNERTSFLIGLNYLNLYFSITGFVTKGDEVPVMTDASISCTATGVSQDSSIEWFDEAKKLTTGLSFTLKFTSPRIG
jgi:hypothetical protein